MKRILVPGLLLMLALFVAVESSGQGFIPLAIYPSAVYLRLVEDRVYESVLLVKNKGDETVDVLIELRDFSISEDGTFLSFDPDVESSNSLAPFLTYSPTMVTLEPEEETSIPYRIELPEDVAGPFWGTLVVSPERASEVGSSTDETTSQTFGVVAKMIYPLAILIHSIDGIEPQAEIAGSDIWLSERDGRSVLNTRFEVANLCQDLLCCAYTLRFYGADGMLVDEQSDPTYRAILPGMSRPFGKMYLADYLPNGTYTVELTLEYGGPAPLVSQLTLEMGGAP